MNTIFSITENYLDYCKTQKMLDKKTLKAYSTDLSQFVSFFNNIIDGYLVQTIE